MSQSNAELRLVYHAADVLFTFGAPVLGIGGNWSQADQVLSTTMLDYWYAPPLDFPYDGLLNMLGRHSSITSTRTRERCCPTLRPGRHTVAMMNEACFDYSLAISLFSPIHTGSRWNTSSLNPKPSTRGGQSTAKVNASYRDVKCLYRTIGCKRGGHLSGPEPAS